MFENFRVRPDEDSIQAIRKDTVCSPLAVWWLEGEKMVSRQSYKYQQYVTEADML